MLIKKIFGQTNFTFSKSMNLPDLENVTEISSSLLIPKINMKEKLNLSFSELDKK